MTAATLNKPEPVTETELFERVENYPWESDTEFQSGLQAILGSNPSPEQAIHLTLRARCFYFSRQVLTPGSFGWGLIRVGSKHNVSLDFDAYRLWHSSQLEDTSLGQGESSTTTHMPSEDHASPLTSLKNSGGSTETTPEAQLPYPMTFSHIVELITTGQAVPGIKDIPDTVHQGMASESFKVQRKKPWEKDCNDTSSRVGNG